MQEQSFLRLNLVTTYLTGRTLTRIRLPQIQSPSIPILVQTVYVNIQALLIFN
jgi:hypothetical protein